MENENISNINESTNINENSDDNTQSTPESCDNQSNDNTTEQNKKEYKEYKMTPQEFIDNMNKILEKFQIAIQQKNKSEVIRNVDLFQLFVHCHIDDM